MSFFYLANFKAGIYKVFFSTILLLVFFTSKGQQMNYALHANIIYRVTKYINWPSNSNNRQGDFTIGIVGDSPLFQELTALVADKKVERQKIAVVKLAGSANFSNCQILFVADEESNRFKKILAKTINSPLLIITESDGLASEGSCINFVIIEDRLKLEINKKNIENRNLKIASELLQLGIPVK